MELNTIIESEEKYILSASIFIYLTYIYICIYVEGSKSFRPDQLFKVTEIKQICYFST